ncbi:MAG: hypothetical protein PHU23_12880, partial [Dehalococcoidales bacterium]|nr:hypothetical protein [Dehalococcoidales bacterium]
MKKQWKSKLCTKRGRYGSSKLKAFTVLANLLPKRYITTRQLCLSTGIDYYSLARALPRWIRYEYVSRQPTAIIGEGDFQYRLLPHGRSWLNLAVDNLPNTPMFLNELKTWQNEIMPSDRFSEFMTLPFNVFVTRLH